MEDILKNNLFEAFASASDNVYIYVCDMATNQSRWSKNSVKYFGLTGEYIEDAGTMWSEKIHPEDRDIYWEDINGVFSGAKKHHSCQYRAKNAKGDYVWLECKGSVIYNENGEMAVFAGLMTRLDNQNKYDSLTGLPTTYDVYAYNLETESGMALLIGIDEFRQIIGNYGYSFGDKVLVSLAKQFEEICTGKEKVYRFGGDEFLFMLKEADESQVRNFYEKVKNIVENQIVINHQKVNLSISAGVVNYPKQGKTIEEMFNNLENSLEHAKVHDRGNMAIFSEEIASKHRRLRILKDDLKNCIRQDFKGFELYFQPLVDPVSQRISGCEALLRWKGEVITDSYPGEFIKILENEGRIRQVGMWVMEQAIKQQREWRDTFGNIYVSFNTSYQQFVDEKFVNALVQKTEEYGVLPEYIIVELTESCQVEEVERLTKMFERLRQTGFQVALDDFGTAYSSFELLKKLPANYIKIEHSFVRELAEEGHEIDYAIIDSLLKLSRQLKCESIVEGVEIQEVDAIVRNMNPTYLQGYYYSRPVCRTEFETLLRERNQNRER